MALVPFSLNEQESSLYKDFLSLEALLHQKVFRRFLGSFPAGSSRRSPAFPTAKQPCLGQEPLGE